jgi:uncharacterized phage protein gp47/JayE
MPSSLTTLAALLVQETKAQIYTRGLAVATSLGLPTTSWVAGDPTRSLYYFLAEVLSALEVNVAGFVASGFLDYATGDWLTLLADQTFNVQRIDATFAETPVTLTNTAGGLYVITPGDVTVKSSTSGKTYTNASGGTLASGSGHTLTLDFVADESGAASSAIAGAIDTLVTGLPGVTCSNATAAVGIDEESDANLRARCRAKLGALSPNGPRDAYDYVVRTPSLAGTSAINRSRTIADGATGHVTTYVAGPSGAVGGSDVDAAQAAVENWAAPLCVTPTVVNCTALPVDITYEVWLYASVGATDAAIKTQHATDLAAMFAARPIGGDIIAPATTGALYVSLIAATLRASYPDQTFRVAVTLPTGDVALAINQVPSVGTISATIHQEVAP